MEAVRVCGRLANSHTFHMGGRGSSLLGGVAFLPLEDDGTVMVTWRMEMTGEKEVVRHFRAEASRSFG